MPTQRDATPWWCFLVLLAVLGLCWQGWVAYQASVQAHYDDLPAEVIRDYWEKQRTVPCALGIAAVYDDRLHPDCSRRALPQ